MCICTTEQLSFVAIHYPEHYSQPIDILMWLYDVAEIRDMPKPRVPTTVGKKKAK